MGQRPTAWRNRSGAGGRGNGPALATILVLTMVLTVLLTCLPLAAVRPAAAAVIGREEHYLCEDEPLVALVDNGAVDAAGIPNSSGGTVPGAFVVLRWKGLTLQLPRTNNAGAPSFTDGKWWWSLEDPDHPRFRLRRGDLRDFSCRRE